MKHGKTLLDTIPEWRKEYSGQDAFTIDEIRAAKGLGYAGARKILDAGIADGTVEQLWRRNGGIHWHKVYRLKP